MQRRELIIDTVKIYCGDVPVKCHFSYGDASTFPFILTQVVSGTWVGWGETLLPVCPDFVSRAQLLVGRNANELDNLIEELFLSVEDVRGEAFSIALHDLAGQARGLPVHALLGECKRRMIPVMPCLFDPTSEGAVRNAQKYMELGVSALKVKLFGIEERDLQIVRAIRRVSPNKSFFLLGDANNGYSWNAMHAGLLRKFKLNGLDAIEDPCDADCRQYAQLRDEKHPLIMIDAMARSTVSLQSALEDGAADIVNLHPCQQGSLSRAMRRARICDSFDVPVFMGGTGYLGIGTATYQQLASIAGLTMPCGELGGAVDHGMPLLVKGITPVSKGRVELQDTMGHGVKPSMTLLKPYIKDSYSFSLHHAGTSVKEFRENAGVTENVKRARNTRV